MNLSIPILIMLLAIPLIMLTFGLLWRKHPPKKINWIYGYRTRRSMKNDETWKFAHMYQGKVWLLSGLVLLAFNFIVYCKFIRGNKELAAWVFYGQMAIMILTILATEIALYRKFDREDKEG